MIAGAILAGGKSSRMGADKAVVPLRGRPLIRWVFDALRPLGPVVVVANGPLSRGLFLGEGVRFARDLYPGAGPVAGVHAALAALAPAEECVVVASCDMPFVFSDLARALAARVLAPGAPPAAAWLDASGRLQHFPAAFHRRALPAVEEALAGEDRSMRRLFARLCAAALDIGDIVPRESLLAQSAAFNVNTPADLEEAEATAARLTQAV